MGHCREPFHVGEERGHLAPFTAELDQIGLLDDALNDCGCEVLLEATAHEDFAPMRHREGSDQGDDEDRRGRERRCQRIHEAIREKRSRYRLSPMSEQPGRHGKRSKDRGQQHACREREHAQQKNGSC